MEQQEEQDSLDIGDDEDDTAAEQDTEQQDEPEDQDMEQQDQDSLEIGDDEDTAAEHEGNSLAGFVDDHGIPVLLGEGVPINSTITPQFYTEFKHNADVLGSAANVLVVGAESGERKSETEEAELSIDVGDISQDEAHEDVNTKVSSPEAAELFMTLLEQEAERDEQAHRETEAQILLYAETHAELGLVERIMTWLPPVSDEVEDGTQVEVQVIHDEILLSAMRWIALEPATPSAPRVRLEFKTQNANSAADEADAEELFRMCERSAHVLQMAYRCHLSRRVHTTQASRRHGNAQGDFSRMAHALMADLVDQECQEDVHEAVSHAVAVVLVLPLDMRRQVCNVMRQSTAPLAVALQRRAADAISRSWRCHAARCVLLARAAHRRPAGGTLDPDVLLPDDALRAPQAVSSEKHHVGATAFPEEQTEAEERQTGADTNSRGSGGVNVDGAGRERDDPLTLLKASYTGGGALELPSERDGARSTAAASIGEHTDDLGDVLTLQQLQQHDPPTSTSTTSASATAATSASLNAPPARPRGGASAHADAAHAGADAAHAGADGDGDADRSAAELREEAAALEAARQVTRAEALEAEKAWQVAVESAAPHSSVKAAQEKAQGLRAAAETLRARSEALIAAAMVKEDASDEERAVSRGRATGAAGAANSGAAAAAWLEREQREADDKAREAAADALARQQREAELEEARRKREAAAQVYAKRREQTLAANQSKLIEERTELAKKTLKLDFSSLGMSSLPRNVFLEPVLQHIRILWLNHNEFQEIPTDIAHFKLLTQLRMMKNRLRSLPPQIGELPALQILWLQDNFLTTLPPEIEKLSSLTLLSLKGNPLKILPVELSRLKKVRELEMTTDNVTFPPSTISRSGTKQVLEFLRRADRAWKTSIFDLSDMELDLLPLDIITLFPSITGLRFDKNSVTEVPFEFHVMTQLKELRFDEHLMRSPAMEIWEALQELGIGRTMEFMRKFFEYRTDPRVDLHAWGLSHIPQEVFDMSLGPCVTLLDFSLNRLTSLPAEVGEVLTSLRDLRVDENELEKVARTVCHLSNLNRLSLTKNKLRAFPNHMHHLLSLRFLYLDDNALEEVPATIVRVSMLEEMSLNRNRITALPQGLPLLRKLQHLLVANNLIERLPVEFHKCTYLATLDISGNPIWSPPPDILGQARPVWFEYLYRLHRASGSQNVELPAGRSIQGGVLEMASFGLANCPPELLRLTQLFSHLVFMNFDYNALNMLPKEIGKLTNLTRLSFNRNRFRVIPDVLGKCHNLTDLNFERNALTFLPSQIGALTALKRLNVDGNNLIQPPMEIVKMGIPAMLRFLKVFSAAESSGEVVMTAADLRSFPMAVVHLDRLRRLDLSHNFIGRVPGEFYATTSAAYVDLSYNDLHEIEGGIRGMTSLHTLILAGNHIKAIPDAIFSLTALRSLILNQNEVEEIPKDIAVLTLLEVLKLSNNNVEKVPMEIGRMQSLHTLILAYNFIAALPTTIGNMTALRELAITGNRIKSLPPIMGTMSGLKELHLTDNELPQHPPEVLTQTVLQVVLASMAKQANTKIWHDGSEPATALCLWLSRLRTARITKDLDASHFSLAAIPTEVLNATSVHLMRLSLEHNCLELIPASVNCLSLLTFLNLAHNSLRELPQTIGTMTNLTVLYLNNNKLMRLPIEMGHLRPTVLSRLALSNNRLETPPKELLTSSTSHILRYYLTSEVGILTGSLDWSWTKRLTSMRRVCLEVPNWQRLVVLRLDDNEIEVLDAQMCLDMPFLEVLSLAKNRITVLPPELAHHTHIRTLRLSQNRITQIPKSFGSMRSLDVLEIAGLALTMPPKDVLKYGTANICAYLCALQQAESQDTCIINHFDLVDVPPEVLALENIEVLEMNSMRLTTIPDLVCLSLTCLTRLSCCSNSISRIPVSIARLTSLTELEVARNNISALLPEIHVLTKLVWLNVFLNPVKTPPFEIVRLILPKKSALQKQATKIEGRPEIVSPRETGKTVTRKPRSPGSGGRRQSPSTSRGAGPDDDNTENEGADPLRPRPDRLLSFLKALWVARVEHVLDVSSYGLVAWPAEVKNTPDITRMHINGNNLRVVPPDVKFLTQVTVMTMDSNEIKSISPDLAQLTQLTELSAAHNKLEAIPESFGALLNLVSLSLVNNDISVLPLELFRCTALKVLLLDSNRITELPPELAQLVNVSILSYEHNPVVNPPDEIRKQGLDVMLAFYKRIILNAPACDIKGLECEALGGELILDEFELVELPPVFHRGLPRPGEMWDENRMRRDRWGLGMTHLTSLSLKGNFLTTLPELISRLQLLSSLVASDNALERLPDSLGKLTNLVTLDLRGNCLALLPSTTSSLSALCQLLLDHNWLLELPNGLGSLPELRTIQVTSNKLTSLPIDLCESKTLRIVELDHNPLRMPPLEIVARGLRAIFDFLSRLHRCQSTQTLDLRALDLDSIDLAILPIPELKRLLLANNRITSIAGKEVDEAALSKAAGPPPPDRPSSVAQESGGGERENTDQKRRDGKGGGQAREGGGNAIQAAVRQVTLLSLQYLNADHNLISQLPETITLLTSLTEMSLGSNVITVLPNGLHVLTNLERLNLRDNPITQLPLDFGEMSTLRKLEIDLDKLTVPPPEISLDGFPIMMRYLADLRAASRTNELEVMGLKLTRLPAELLSLTTLTKLIASSNKIREVNLEICFMSRLTDLRLSKNLIAKVPRELFESLTNLRCLRLDNNKISVIPLQICNMSKLYELRLEQNQITILPLEMGNLVELQVLGLDVEDMVSPYPEICDRGPKLIVTYLSAVRAANVSKTVDLRGLALTSFPVEIYTLSSITALHLDDNNITSLPPSIERLTSLTELTLTNLQLQSLPFVMGAMTGLVKLSLSVSRMMRNPPYEIVMQGTAVLLEFMRKSYLCVRKTGYMNISQMRLEQLPKEVLSLGNLQHLQARGNVILHISSAMSQMNCIRKLHLHGNGLLYLPPEVGQLVTLVELRLAHNRLKVLPKELGHCFNLRKLSCQNNFLSTLPPDMCGGLSCLLNLNMSCNQMCVLPDELGYMVNLEKLRLDQNQLRHLPQTIGACTALMILSLTCNQLSGIPDSFKDCGNLTALHLSSNRLRQLPRCVDDLTALRQLWASNNELIGLPTSLARLPNLVDLQVKGAPDLKFPPPEIVTSGHAAVMAFLMSNMRYEDMEGLADKEEIEASLAEAKAKDDCEAALLAASLIGPLKRFADAAEERARAAEFEAVQLRGKANVHKRFDIRELVRGQNPSWLPEEQEVEIRRLQNKANEDEGNAVQAEDQAARLRADANAAQAKANEARHIHEALARIAETTTHLAKQKRIDADAQKAVSTANAKSSGGADASSPDDDDDDEQEHVLKAKH